MVSFLVELSHQQCLGGVGADQKSNNDDGGEESDYSRSGSVENEGEKDVVQSHHEV